MKQTAIQISMINNINNSDNNGEQLMTSLEIAALTGKKHCHVMEAIPAHGTHGKPLPLRSRS